MEYRTVGRSGLKVSAVGLGCNNFGLRIDEPASQAVVHQALDLGITLFDTADSYGNRGDSERMLGRALGPRRKDIVVATKFGWPMDDIGQKRGASRRYIMQAVEDSLARLGTDWIDLYQLHRPDPDTPLLETLEALGDLVRQGKVRYVGCSGLASWQIAEAAWLSKTNGLPSFISTQEEYSLLVRSVEGELMPALQHYGVGLLPYYPLASGLLSGKYAGGVEVSAKSRLGAVPRWRDQFATDGNMAKVERLIAFCTARGWTILELAMSWLAQNPGVSSVIAGATSSEQVAQNASAAQLRLSPEDLDKIDEILRSVKE